MASIEESATATPVAIGQPTVFGTGTVTPVAAGKTTVELETLFREAKVPEPFARWMEAKGFCEVVHFAKVAHSIDGLISKLIEPFIDGVTLKGVEYKLDGDPDFFEAAVVVAWQAAQNAAKIEQPPVQPQVSQIPQAPAPKPVEKAPKTLPLVFGQDRWQNTRIRTSLRASSHKNCSLAQRRSWQGFGGS